MLRPSFVALFVCLALFTTAYDASAKPRQTDTATYGAKSAKSVKTKAKSRSAKLSKKEAAQSSDKAGVIGSTKKPSKKQLAKASKKSKSAKAKPSKSRKSKRSGRDFASLPMTDEAFVETPDSVLTALAALPADGIISSPFGRRRLARKTKRVQMHTGIDILAQRGTPVFAAAPGVVCFAGRWSSYGRIVEIDHGNGLVTRYAHLDGYTVETGVQVAPGEVIGAVGRSGRTTGAHLHFETLVNGRAVNPMMAEIWQQTPEQLAAKRGMYVSGLRSASKRFY